MIIQKLKKSMKKLKNCLNLPENKKDPLLLC